MYICQIGQWHIFKSVNIDWAPFSLGDTKKNKTWALTSEKADINKLRHSILNAMTHYDQSRKEKEVINSFWEDFTGSYKR